MSLTAAHYELPDLPRRYRWKVTESAQGTIVIEIQQRRLLRPWKQIAYCAANPNATTPQHRRDVIQAVAQMAISRAYQEENP